MKNSKLLAWVWIFLSVIWIGRGLNTVYRWLKHGFALDFLDWTTGFRLFSLVVGILLLVKYVPLLKTNTSKPTGDSH